MVDSINSIIITLALWFTIRKLMKKCNGNYIQVETIEKKDKENRGFIIGIKMAKSHTLLSKKKL